MQQLKKVNGGKNKASYLTNHKHFCNNRRVSKIGNRVYTIFTIVEWKTSQFLTPAAHTKS